jgi:seryl-tRNA synthetase
MLDIAFIRSNPEVIKEGIRKKRMPMDVDELLSVDEELRKIRAEVEGYSQAHR